MRKEEEEDSSFQENLDLGWALFGSTVIRLNGLDIGWPHLWVLNFFKY